MADRFRQAKKCGSRWLWLVVIVYLCLPGAFAVGYSTLHVHPEGTIQVRLGEALEIFCTDDHSADNIQFVSGAMDATTFLPDVGLPTVVHSEKINDTTIRLYKKMNVKGVYRIYCIKRKEGNGRCLSIVRRVLVDEAPLNITDFQCKSYNLEQLTCSWTVPETVTIVKHSLDFTINGQRTNTCKTHRRGATASCTWSNNSSPRYRQLEEQYFFTLTSSNVFGSLEQNFIVDHFSVVQPAPVRYLKVHDIGAYSARLQWRVPNNMVDFLPYGVTHRLEYRVDKIDNTSYFRSVDASSLPKKNSTYQFLLSLPYAHMKYEVRISIRPVEATEEQYWSDPNYVTFHTKGKSTGEIGELIYNNWRKSMKTPSPAFGAKLRHMKAQKQLRNVLSPREHGPLSLMSILLSGISGISDNGF